MLRLNHIVTVTQQPSKAYPFRDKVLYFDFCNNIEVNRSYENFTQTAEITLPRNIKYKNAQIFNKQTTAGSPLLMRGDTVVIEAGYNKNIEVIFSGYISKINTEIPMIIYCEDDMWVLKQTICPNYSKRNATLKSFINDTLAKQFPTMPIEAITADLGLLRINEANYGNIFEKLRSEYGIYTYFQLNGKEAPILKIGLPFYAPKKTKTFLIERVFIDSDLKWVTKDEVKLKIKGVLIKGSEKTEKEFGDADGELRTVFQYGGTVSDLERTCKQFLEDSKYTGYIGSFETFLEPIMDFGDHVIINSYKYPDRSGTYLVKENKISVGVGGGRQSIELDRKI